MNKSIIEIDNVSKVYRLGVIGSTTIRESIDRWFARTIKKDKALGMTEPMIEPDHPQAGDDPNTFWALRNISFAVGKGEVVGIIGSNGAGKSTLLKILSRVTEPTSGRAVLRGRLASLLEVGTGFHPELTGAENVYLNGAILGMRKREIDRKFDEIVAFAEIEKFVHTPVKRYSSGMYVRLAFAVAAHLDPDILLVDEVLAVGDVAFQKKCLGKMGEVAGEGRTVLFVSHNMGAVETLCNSGVLLKSGAVHDIGPVSDVVRKYLALAQDKENIPIAQRKDRSGNGQMLLEDLWLCACEDSKRTKIVMTGDSIQIHLIVSSKIDHKDCFLGLQLFDSYKKLIFSFHGESGFRPHVLNGKNHFILRIPVLLLLSGRYTVSFKLLTSDRNVTDSIEDAFAFDILPKDLYGCGKAFDGKHGITLIPHHWSWHHGENILTTPNPFKILTLG